ncbi:MAG: DUF1330 domain-containing protein, partial [Dongiaceae bacterium]
MKAYCIVYETIDDPVQFDEYRKQAVPTAEAAGGRFLVGGGKHTVLEGDMPHQIVVVIEFASRERAEAWYNSPAYQKV